MNDSSERQLYDNLGIDMVTHGRLMLIPIEQAKRVLSFLFENEIDLLGWDAFRFADGKVQPSSASSVDYSTFQTTQPITIQTALSDLDKVEGFVTHLEFVID